MSYLSPAWHDLQEFSKQLNSIYKNGNQKRIALITENENIISILDKENISENEKQQIALAAFFFILDEIKDTYSVDPNYKNLSFITSFANYFKLGSTLYALIQKKLNINDNNQPTEEEKLIVYQKLLSFLSEYKSSNDKQLSFLKEHGLDLNKFIEKLNYQIEKTLECINSLLLKIENHTPIGNVITNQLVHFGEDYLKLKGNPTNNKVNMKRLFCAQLIEAVDHVAMRALQELPEKNNDLSQVQQIVMGALIYSANLIKQEYKSFFWQIFGSPNNSKQYATICKILNVNGIDDFNEKDKQNYLRALFNFLETPSIINNIIIYGEKNFKNNNLLAYNLSHWLAFQSNLKLYIKMVDECEKHNWPATYLFALLGATVMAPFGYGVGNFVGNVVNELEFLVAPKIAVSSLINRIGKNYISSNAGDYFGFLVSNKMALFSLERLFGKAFEYLAMLLGGVSFGLVGGMIVDLSYKGLKEFCHYIQDVEKNVTDPEIIKNIDPQFINSLLKLPDEFISKKKKEKIIYGFQVNNLFNNQNLQHNDLNDKQDLNSDENVEIENVDERLLQNK